MMLICLCGVLKGKAHAADCPYPEYGTADGLIDRWEDHHAAKYRAAVAAAVAQPALPGEVGAVRDVEIVAPALADVGFSLVAPVARDGSKAGKLF